VEKEEAMRIAATISFVMVASLLAASAAFAGSRADLGKAAERLENEARLAAAHADTVSPQYQEDARDLAERAWHFRSDVETATVSDSAVSAQFQRLAESYRRFREEVEHANTQQTYADLRAVTVPYQDVQRELGIQPVAELPPPPSG
jgi:hypothetical protein